METNKIKEPAQSANCTSSNNNSLSNYDDTSCCRICQDATEKKMKICYEDALWEISIILQKLRCILNDTLEEWDFAERPEYPDFINLRNKKPKETTRKEKNAEKIIVEYQRLITYINISADYAWEIQKVLKSTGIKD